MTPERAKPRRRRGSRDLPASLPVLPLINTVVFPRMTVPLLVEMPASISAVLSANSDRPVVMLVAQRREDLGLVNPDDLYQVGTVAQVVQSIRVPSGGLQVVVQGLTRAKVTMCTSVDYATGEPRAAELPVAESAEPASAPGEAEGDGGSDRDGAGDEPVAPTTGPGPTFLRTTYEALSEGDTRTLTTEALMRSVMNQLEQLIEKGRSGHPEVLTTARSTEEPGWLADIAAFAPDLTVAQRQQLLEITDPTDRLRAVSGFLSHHLDIVDLKNKIQGEIHKGMEKTQREYFLREQIKAIHRELGDGDPQQTEIEGLRQRVIQAGMPEAVRERATREIDRLPMIPPGSPETG
ncbi:MAG: hypothetical protein EB033_10535, partial [Proteobacteria bacterium]|nr:hypothetical protein [Pseudomonadota bacterium]